MRYIKIYLLLKFIYVNKKMNKKVRRPIFDFEIPILMKICQKFFLPKGYFI